MGGCSGSNRCRACRTVLIPTCTLSYTGATMSVELPIFSPGTRVRVTQQISNSHDAPWSNSIEGLVCRYRQSKTGSWFAHSKDDRLWLDRLEIEREDGELVVLNLDQFTKLENLDQ